MAVKITQNGTTAQFKVEFANKDGDRIQAIVTVPSHPFPDSVPIEKRKKIASEKARALAQALIEGMKD